MIEYIFSGSLLEQPITLVTNRFNENIQNLTVFEIKLGQEVLSELPDLGNKTQTEIKLLTEFMRLSYSNVDIVSFAAKNGLNLTSQDQESSSQVVEIKIADLDVDAVNYQVSTKFTRYTFSGTPDLSNISSGNYIYVSGSINPSNDGLFQIQSVNDASDYVDVYNPERSSVDDDESSSTGVGVISNF